MREMLLVGLAAASAWAADIAPQLDRIFKARFDAGEFNGKCAGGAGRCGGIAGAA
jgi:hypothetical protein